MGHRAFPYPFVTHPFPTPSPLNTVHSADRLQNFLKPAFSFFLAVSYYMDSAVYSMSEFELIFMPIIEYFQS